MLHRTIVALVAAVAGALIAAPVAAADTASAQAGGYDPNERICEKMIVTGSRLASKKVCMTRAQWDERRRDDRDSIERAQRAAHVGCSTVHTRTSAPVCN
jgi:hypothetical protein